MTEFVTFVHEVNPAIRFLFILYKWNERNFIDLIFTLKSESETHDRKLFE